MTTWKTWVAAAAVAVLASTAHGALIDRGGGMIYDTTRNVTWLADMNYAKSSGYDSDGLMTWAAANEWADNLVFGGFSDWRLPTLDTSDTNCSLMIHPSGFDPQYYGNDCTAGELSGLFITDLGNKAGESVLDQAGDTAEQIANLAMFSNVQSNDYWSGTGFAPLAGFAWVFVTTDAFQTAVPVSSLMFATAVRSGDVAVAVSVPEPATLALTLLALGVTAVARKGRQL